MKSVGENKNIFNAITILLYLKKRSTHYLQKLTFLKYRFFGLHQITQHHKVKKFLRGYPVTL